MGVVGIDGGVSIMGAVGVDGAKVGMAGIVEGEEGDAQVSRARWTSTGVRWR